MTKRILPFFVFAWFSLTPTVFADDEVPFFNVFSDKIVAFDRGYAPEVVSPQAGNAYHHYVQNDVLPAIGLDEAAGRCFAGVMLNPRPGHVPDVYIRIKSVSFELTATPGYTLHGRRAFEAPTEKRPGETMRVTATVELLSPDGEIQYRTGTFRETYTTGWGITQKGDDSHWQTYSRTWTPVDVTETARKGVVAVIQRAILKAALSGRFRK